MSKDKPCILKKRLNGVLDQNIGLIIQRFPKFMGKKLIYIESFAKVTSPTETGKLLYKFADQFYVQWKPMLKFYPKAIYLGGIY